MIPEAGSTCQFTFTVKFATLNGIYRIRTITTFADALASGIDFVKYLYTPAGLQLSDFNSDRASYLKDRIAVLESVVDTSVVYYTPESIFLTVPDPTIKEYNSLTLVVRLGVQQNTQAVFPLIDQVKDLIQASLGTTDPVRITTNPQNKVYLTDNEYAALQAARAANIEALSPLSVQLQNEIAKNTYLAAKVAAYETLITQLQAPQS